MSYGFYRCHEMDKIEILESQGGRCQCGRRISVNAPRLRELHKQGLPYPIPLHITSKAYVWIHLNEGFCGRCHRKKLRLESKIHGYSRVNIRRMNYTERIVWNELHEMNYTLPDEVYWQRQYVIGKYIVDFACKKALLIIEVNGLSHVGKEMHDAYRQFRLGQVGWEVLNLGEEVFDPKALYAFMRAVKVKTLLRLNKYNR